MVLDYKLYKELIKTPKSLSTMRTNTSKEKAMQVYLSKDQPQGLLGDFFGAGIRALSAVGAHFCWLASGNRVQRCHTRELQQCISDCDLNDCIDLPNSYVPYTYIGPNGNTSRIDHLLISEILTPSVID